MYATIVVPLDGSALAERALPCAVALAGASRARLVLVRAALAHTVPGADPTAAQARATQRAAHELAAVADRLRGKGLTVETHIYADDPARAIADAAEQQAAGLIVMSTHGRSGLGRWVYGSVADRVLRRAAVPVLLVPAGVRPARIADAPLRVVVPLDGSMLAEEVLSEVHALPATRAAELVLLRVVEPPAPIEVDGGGYVPRVQEEAELTEARRYLESVAARLRLSGLQVTGQAVVGEAAPAIVAAAVEREAGLIAMATHGRGGVARLVLGSVAAGVLHRATTPVLFVRPTAVREETIITTPAAGTAALPILVALHPTELALVQQGLEALLREAEPEAGVRVPEARGPRVVSDLLARLRQAKREAPPELEVSPC